MGSLKVLNHTGHTTLTYEPGTKESDEAREAWDRAIEEEHKVGFDLKTKEPTKEFDEEKDLIVVPPLAGG